MDELTRSLFETPEGVDRFQYESAFRLTYASFTNPSELIHLLQFLYRESDNMASQPKVFRIRICNFCQKWAHESFKDLRPQDVQDIEAFAQLVKSVDGDAPSAKILETLKKGPSSLAETTGLFTDPPPTPIMPATGRFTFLDLNPVELARQLTILEHGLYRRIRPFECLDKGWTLKDKELRSPNVLRMVRLFNRHSQWISTLILQQPDVKLRVQTIENIISCAEALRALNNFNAINELISGLGFSAVRRLNKTWEKVSKPKLQALEALREVMNPSRNYSNYRVAISQASPPITPFVGTYLTDLVFIDEGNPDFLREEPSFINFAKRQQCARVIEQMTNFQHSPYNLLSLQIIQTYLETVHVLSEDELYAESYKVEPRTNLSQSQA